MLLAGLLMLGTVAMAGGIRFEQLDVNAAVAKAKKENKLVFIDVYTTWCGPCKWLSKNVFTDDAVGTYYNEHFVCIKVDAEKGQGPELARQ